MRIICVTFEAPTRKYGGGLGIIQSLTSMSSFAKIDYIGPEFDTNEFQNIKVNECYFLERNKNVFSCALNLARGLPTRYYQSWKKIISKLDATKYDAVLLDFSNQDFVATWAKKNNLKVITRVHNIESDMIDSIRKTKKFDRYKFKSFLASRAIKRREKKCIKLSSALVFLTKNDMNRGIELFGEQISKKSYIVPVCIDDSSRVKYDNPVNSKYILITGLLSYGANSEGILWFLKNVWSTIQKEDKINHEYKLVVAGGRPSLEIQDVCQNTKNVILVDTPKIMDPYFQHAEFYVAPIFRGAGMKVKVAEAFSYGLNVIGTNHALIGYDAGKDFYIEVDNVEKFINAISKLSNQNLERKQCIEMFKSSFSLEVSGNIFKQIFENVLKSQ